MRQNGNLLYLRGCFFTLFILTLIGAASSCRMNNADVSTIVIASPKDSLRQQPIHIALAGFPNSEVLANSEALWLINSNGDSLPAQTIDSNGDGKADELFFVADIWPNEKQTYKVSLAKGETTIERRAAIRLGVRHTAADKVVPADTAIFYPDQLPGVIGYQHFQTDGPTWENDKAGFRLYLDGRNSIDVFGKTNPNISPANVGLNSDGVTENNYQTMQPWGMDILAVGNSLGLGGISFLVQDSVLRLGVTEQDSLGNVDETKCTVLNNGPLFASLRFAFNHWRTIGRDYSVSNTISIWPGMPAFKAEISCNNLQGDETLVIGLVNSKTRTALRELIVDDNWIALYTYDKQSADTMSAIGLALIVPRKSYKGYMQAPATGKVATSFLAKMELKNSGTLQYYALAAWELGVDKITDVASFEKMLQTMGRQLAYQANIEIK